MNGLLGYGDSPSSDPHENKIESNEIKHLRGEAKQAEEGGKCEEKGFKVKYKKREL